MTDERHTCAAKSSSFNPCDSPSAIPRALRERAEALLKLVESRARTMRSWGVDESKVDYSLMLGQSWLVVHLGDAIRVLLAALAAVTQREEELQKYVQHKSECAKWGEVWEYPRRLHHELPCTCGLSTLLPAAAVTQERDQLKDELQKKEEKSRA